MRTAGRVGAGGGTGLDGRRQCLVSLQGEGKVSLVGLGGVAHRLGERLQVDVELGEGVEERGIALGDCARQDVPRCDGFAAFPRGHGSGAVECVDGVLS